LYTQQNQVHTFNLGVAHFAFANEFIALSKVRDLVGYLPSSNRKACPRKPKIDSSYLQINSRDRLCLSLDNVIPRDSAKGYDMKYIIRQVVDIGEFFEVMPTHSPNIIIGFGRIDGATVGFVANQPSVLSGVLDIDSSIKAARFIRFCDCFNIPLVSFVGTDQFT
jgi:propionyl-CoA carboxylase beta chain